MMQTMTQDEAITYFSQLMAPYMNGVLVDPRSLMDTVATFYAEVRISGAVLEDDGDMLLLQWSSTNSNSWNWLLEGFTDFRLLTDDDLGKFATHTYRTLNLTRQIYCPGQRPDGFDDNLGDEFEDDFDDVATGLSVDLLFEPIEEEKVASNIWVERPSLLAERLQEFFNVPLVKELLEVRPFHINASVGRVG